MLLQFTLRLWNAGAALSLNAGFYQPANETEISGAGKMSPLEQAAVIAAPILILLTGGVLIVFRKNKAKTKRKTRNKLKLDLQFERESGVDGEIETTSATVEGQ